MKVNENIVTEIKKAGTKDKTYFWYGFISFLLFASISILDIASLFFVEGDNFNYANCIFGCFFLLIALLSLGYVINYLLTPKQIIDIDFQKQKLIIRKKFNKTYSIDLKSVDFILDNSNKFFGFLTRYAKLSIYTKIGEIYKVNFLSNAKVMKKALELSLMLRQKYITKENPVKLFFLRICHFALVCCINIIYRKKPKIIDNYDALATSLSKKHIKKVLLIESRTIKKNALDESLLKALEAKSIEHVSFTDIRQNPLTSDCEKAKKVFLENKCDAIIAIGGGSVIDASKVVSALVYAKKEAISFKGMFKIHNKVASLVAIPTTCGTGSETTFVSVVSDSKSNVKFEIISNKIVPSYCVLDANLLSSLPLYFVGSTAMDALTHAVESYLNLSRTSKSKKQSLEAIKLIYENLEVVHSDPSNLKAKENLLKASFIAGQAFNQALVGPVHALAHALGGKYNLQHGYLNAILLPYFLRAYQYKLYKDMGKISITSNISNTGNLHQDAFNLIEYIEKINKLFEFNDKIKEIKDEDIDELASRAYKEAHLLYPSKYFVPKRMYQEILMALKEE